jgi:hypothetical protein
MKVTHRFVLLAYCAVLAISASVASGAVLAIPMMKKFSGTPSPPALPPWVYIYLDDSAQNGSLELWIDNAGLTDGIVTEVYMNFKDMDPDDAYDVAQLKFTPLLAKNVGSFIVPSVGSSSTPIELAQDDPNDFKADGDGYFDIRMEFESSNGSAEADRFGVDSDGTPEKIYYELTHPNIWLTLAMFMEWSAPGGGAGPYMAAMHLQSSQAALGGWVSHDDEGTPGYPEIVPEPATLVLLLSASGGLLINRRRKA